MAGDLDGWFPGKEGEGFIRLNLACPRSIVEEALKRIESVLEIREDLEDKRYEIRKVSTG